MRLTKKMPFSQSSSELIFNQRAVIKTVFNENHHKEHSSKIMDFDTILKTQFPAAFPTWGDFQRRGASQPEQQGVLSQLSPDSL